MVPHKVLVVDDSAFMRKIIADLIMDDRQFEIVGTAKNGQEAVEKAKLYKPDVITMDVEMPVMNGLEALQAIMQHQPVPVVMLSSLTDTGTYETIRALELGAVDFIRKPSGSISLDLYKVQSILLEKLKMAVYAKVGRRSKPQSEPAAQLPEQPYKPPAVAGTFEHIVAIGTSTGGPRALQTVLTALPASFPAPILVVQHMPPNFTKSLAQRIDALSMLHVVEAEHEMSVVPGYVYIAPGGWHMRLARAAKDKYCIRLNKDDPLHGHRPAVDMMFDSLLPFTELKRHAVLMTGMGSDGARGMKALKQGGGSVTTIAESEDTCIVYGMPRAAAELKAVDHQIALHDISHKIAQLVR